MTTLNFPSDIKNIILDYWSQLNNRKWSPFIESKNEKLIWKVNKYSSKYKNINCMLIYKKHNPIKNIYVDVHMLNGIEISDRIYGTLGTILPLKRVYIVNKWDIIVSCDAYYMQFIIGKYLYSVFYIAKYNYIFKNEYDIYINEYIENTENTLYGTFEYVTGIDENLYAIEIRRY
jgi:hypothetical protein